MFRELTTDNMVFNQYIEKIENSFCPFLSPARENKVLFFTRYSLPFSDMTDLQEVIFYSCMIHTEILRKERTVASNEKVGLMCENNLYSFPGEDSVNGGVLLSMPHWLLKCLYTQTGLLFGKFWKGEVDISKTKKPIPSPPEHFISIRPAVKNLDHRFFSKVKILRGEFEVAQDHGQDVLEPFFDKKSKTVVNEALLSKDIKINQERIVNTVNELRETNLYNSISQWAM